MTNLERAILIAEKAHERQVYDEIYPYMYHVLKVVEIAKELGYGEDILIACALHDTLEDTNLTYNKIKNAFGDDVANIVYAVTDELGMNRKERKEKTYQKIKANWKAIVVKICDRIANMEHSYLYNKDTMFKMYVKELPTFRKELISDDNEIYEKTKEAWDYFGNFILSIGIDYL